MHFTSLSFIFCFITLFSVISANSLVLQSNHPDLKSLHQSCSFKKLKSILHHNSHHVLSTKKNSDFSEFPISCKLSSSQLDSLSSLFPSQVSLSSSSSSPLFLSTRFDSESSAFIQSFDSQSSSSSSSSSQNSVVVTPSSSNFLFISPDIIGQLSVFFLFLILGVGGFYFVHEVKTSAHIASFDTPEERAKKNK
mmetsp:Transcript_12711/g.19110  ORF Transcript_12711/g.19110 Transcript_12711/m.19110 type:complete len:194 (+) Transcript_12711:35-616(+)